MQLEEGEIDDDSHDGLDPYTPLERPSLGTDARKPLEESDKESEGKYSSDSDSDEMSQPKRPKMRRLNVLPPKKKKKNYSIWCKESNDQLTDFLGNFGTLNPERDRNVEQYTPIFINDEKRKIPAQKINFQSAKLEPILLEELVSSESDTFECIAKEISAKLNEENYDLVFRIVVVCGKNKAIEFYNRTREIEGDGGMLIVNQSRRRTSGGVFILLVRTNRKLTRAQKEAIFEFSIQKEKKNRSKKKKQLSQKNYQVWLQKMNYEKGVESGQEELNNPPPSPDPHCPEPLPELRLRRDMLCYSDLNLHHSTDSDDAKYEDSQNSKIESTSFCALSTNPEHVPIIPPPVEEHINTRPIKDTSHTSSESPHKRDIVSYEDLNSMELIYD